MTRRKSQRLAKAKTNSPAEKIPMNKTVTIDTAMTKIHDTLCCTICQDLMFSPFITACGHSFCYGCLTEWFKSQLTCPACRTKVNQIPTMNHTVRDMVQVQADLLVTTDKDPESRKEILDKIRKEKEGDYLSDVKSKKPLFSGKFDKLSKTVIDRGDGVSRCGYCHWELRDSVCTFCGREALDFSSEEEPDEDDLSSEEGDPLPRRPRIFDEISDEYAAYMSELDSEENSYDESDSLDYHPRESDWLFGRRRNSVSSSESSDEFEEDSLDTANQRLNANLKASKGNVPLALTVEQMGNLAIFEPPIHACLREYAIYKLPRRAHQKDADWSFTAVDPDSTGSADLEFYQPLNCISSFLFNYEGSETKINELSLSSMPPSKFDHFKAIVAEEYSKMMDCRQRRLDGDEVPEYTGLDVNEIYKYEGSLMIANRMFLYQSIVRDMQTSKDSPSFQQWGYEFTSVFVFDGEFEIPEFIDLSFPTIIPNDFEIKIGRVTLKPISRHIRNFPNSVFSYFEVEFSRAFNEMMHARDLRIESERAQGKTPIKLLENEGAMINMCRFVYMETMRRDITRVLKSKVGFKFGDLSSPNGVKGVPEEVEEFDDNFPRHPGDFIYVPYETTHFFIEPWGLQRTPDLQFEIYYELFMKGYKSVIDNIIRKELLLPVPIDDGETERATLRRDGGMKNFHKLITDEAKRRKALASPEPTNRTVNSTNNETGSRATPTTRSTTSRNAPRNSARNRGSRTRSRR